MGKTREEHVQWCKQRARREYEYYSVEAPSEAIRNSIASMLSDLGKHPEMAGMQQTAFLLSMTVKDEASLFRFIDGFN